MNRINYFSAAMQVRAMQADHRSLSDLFNDVLYSDSKGDFSQTLAKLNRDYCSIYCGRRQAPRLKEMFDDYLLSAKTVFPPEHYMAFLKYLSLYVTGKMPHDVFIRLFLRFFAKDRVSEEPLVQYLPAFLSGIQSCSFCISEVANLAKSVNENLALESILDLTVSLNRSSIAKSVSKCLSCLSSGLIAPDVARTWLLVWCKPDVVERMGKISDFSYFHPARFPHELILCPDFVSNEAPTSVCQKFLDYSASKRIFSTYKPVSTELLLLKMRGLRKIIKKLNDGAEKSRCKVTAQQLSFAYGDDSHSLAKVLQAAPSIVVERLGQFYEEAHRVLETIYKARMSKLRPSDVEYRMAFRKLMSREYVGFRYTLIGCRAIHFGSRHLIDIVVALVNDFLSVYFEQEASEWIYGGLETIAPVFEAENYDSQFIVYDKPLYAVIYMAQIAKMISESGDFSAVNVVDGSLDCPQESEYGKKLASLPRVLKNTDVELKDLFGDTVMQHVDIVLTRCVRMLYSFSKTDARMRVFPDLWPDISIITTLKQEGTDEDLSLICNSIFSPCYMNFSEEPSETSESS